MRKSLYNVLLIVFAAVFIVSAVIVGRYYWDTYQEQSRFNQLSQLRPSEVPRPLPGEPVPDGETVPQETEPQMVEVTDPKTGQTRLVLPEFAQLYEMNSDIVGWMSIPCIGVDYPVMHTPEKPQYYLRRNFDKEKNTHGCLFIQYDCDVFAPSDNITIYGHRMRDGTMFGKLNKFRKKSYRDENPYIYFDTLTERHTYEIMSVFLTTATVGEGFRYHAFINAETEEEFDDFVKQCKKLALYDSGVDAKFGDKLICLSTCEYSQVNGRLIVVAKRVA